MTTAQQQDQIAAAAAELDAWAALTGQPLPMPARLIATMEAAGLVVDLMTGETSQAAPSAAVTLTAAGRTLFEQEKRQ